MKLKDHFVKGLTVALALATFGSPASAGELSYETQATPKIESWMARDLQQAWDNGYKGNGSRVTVVDTFWSGPKYDGNLTGVKTSKTHGGWTYEQVSLIAPEAQMETQNLKSSRKVIITRKLDVINLSYGMNGTAGFDPRLIAWSDRESSIISYANEGKAVVVKSAGNDNVAVGTRTGSGKEDYLAKALIGADTAIFVGALNRNGTTAKKATKAGYSNRSGNNKAVQKQFLMVGVESNKTGLAGTSFAAPVVSGYAAVLGSKFKRASAKQITDQLLNTARTDTISGYSASVHGRGEASISRALAPRSIR